MQYYKVYFEGEEEEFAHRINIRTIHTMTDGVKYM